MINVKNEEVLVVKNILEYLITNKKFENNVFDMFDLFGENIDNINEMKTLFSRYFGDSTIIRLKKEYVEIYEKIVYFLADFIYYEKKSYYDHFLDFSSIILKNVNEEITNLDMIKISACYYSLCNKATNFGMDYYVSEFVASSITITEKTNLLNTLCNYFSEKYYSKTLLDLFGSCTLTEVFSFSDVNTFADFKKSSKIYKLIFCLNDVFNIYDNLIVYFGNINLLFEEKFKDTLDRVSIRSAKILEIRYGLIDGKVLTLEEIGNHYNLTRERIRQLEIKGSDKIKKVFYQNIKFIRKVYEFLKKGESEYILYQDLYLYLGTKKNVYLFLMYIDLFFDDIKNDRRLLILYSYKYNEKVIELCDEILENFSFVVTKEEYLNLHDDLKIIFNYRYKEFNSVYLKKSIRIKDVIDYEIQEQFGKQMLLTEESFNIFNSKLVKKYGLEEELSMRNFKNILERSEYVLIDKHCYSKIHNLVKLPKEVENKIFEYLFAMNSFLYYKDFYATFKDELFKYGVNNIYYFKSLVDSLLPEEFLTTKDYIYSNNYSDVINKAINQMKAFNRPFDFNDLYLNLPNISKRIIKRVITKELQSDLLKRLDKKFIYPETIIENIEADFLYEYINKLIDQLGEGFVATRKVYFKMHFDGILNKFNYIDNSYDLFTLLKNVLGNKLTFKRPFISKGDNDRLTNSIVLNDYVSEFNTIEFDEIYAYCNKVGVRRLSRLEIANTICDNFCLISIEKFVNKENDNINDFLLNRIKQVLNLIIGRETVINCNKFNKYLLLPNIGYKWNKYLLHGVLVSYLGDEFEIEYINKKFDDLEYVVRRLNNDR